MAIQTRAYFQAKFITGYIITQQDMTDLTDSVVFWYGDMGIDTKWRVLGCSPQLPNVIAMSSQNIIGMPRMDFINPVTVDLSLNFLTSLNIPLSWSLLTVLDVHGNALTSLDVPANLVNLNGIVVHDNALSALTVDYTLTQITGINAHDNLLTDFVTSEFWTILSFCNLEHNNLTIAGVEHVLTGIAASGAACTVDVSGGNNALKSTWTAPALQAEIDIVANGGSVALNP